MRFLLPSALSLLVACSGPPPVVAIAPPPPSAPVPTPDAGGPSVAISVDGVARDQAGKPVAGAIVALVPHAASRALATTTAGPDGRFHFSAPSGSYALTATAAGLAAGYRRMAAIDATLADADVALGDGGAFTVKGTLRLAGVTPSAGAKICARRLSNDDGDLFYAVTDAAGAFALTLPPARGYVVTLDDDASIVAPVPIHDSSDQTVVLIGSSRAPAPEEVVEWVRQKAVPIATTDPAHDVSDLEPLGAIVGSARVVALGEATHGTREFFQLKHRMLEYLVERQGFTVFAIEASYPESLAVNEYVLHGTGDPKKALAGMYFWTWDTEEVLAQIEWMRRWNADPRHVKKVTFVGFDMQTAHVAVERVLDYLAKVDAGAAKAATATLAPLNRENEQRYGKIPPEQRAATEAGVTALLALFDREKTRWSARTSPAAWAVARQHARIITQTVHGRSSSDSSSWRDESMANNARWILDQEPRGTRMIVWAHNAHVNEAAPAAYTFTPMGSHLSRALGKDYVALGFVFDRGGFQAMEGTGRFGAFQVGEVGAGDLAEAFHRAGKPIFALDLRHPPEGVVAEWMAAPHLMRQIGAVYTDEVGMNTTVVLPRLFDAILYVDETTRARPLPLDVK
jgi:erythromycin esterase